MQMSSSYFLKTEPFHKIQKSPTRSQVRGQSDAVNSRPTHSNPENIYKNSTTCSRCFDTVNSSLSQDFNDTKLKTGFFILYG